MNDQSPALNKRLIFIIISLTDVILGGLVLLVYFGYLPLDLNSWGVPRWLVGVFGAAWFFSGLGILAYQVIKVMNEE